MTRTFDAKPAVRESVPLLIGIMGPSGAGKTFSALRLATGIQTVTGGDIYVIDTEARRALHYADSFKFKHVQFDAPFGSLDYLAAIQQCVKQGAKVIVVDSMSHEHTGPGGYLDFQEAEVKRMAGDDYAKRERVKMAGWIRPAGERRKMIDGILQLNANFIFCFRAKEKTKPVKGGGIREMGFMPIAGDEFVFEMTACCLLMPGANGVPTWQSENVGEKQMIKTALQFNSLFADSKPLDENIGRNLAQWAKGGEATPRGQQAAAQPAAPSASREESPDGAAEHYGIPAYAQPADKSLADAARKGTAALMTAWQNLDPAERRALKDRKDDHKRVAELVDAQEGVGA
jgi:ABC-type dipeptide/oligopeptide/nickel transport system ATPase subunit